MLFPQRTDAHIIESDSVEIFKSVMPKGWVVRKTSEADYGIDLYVEICDSHSMTGQLFAVQLKGTETPKYDVGNTYLSFYGLKPSTLNYWYNLPAPVLFVLVDNIQKECFYCGVKQYIRENFEAFSKECLTTLKIPVSQKLNAHTSNSVLKNFYQKESGRQTLESHIINFMSSVSRKVELLQNHNGMDAFMPIEGEDEIEIIQLVKELMCLASCLGIAWHCDSLEDVIKRGQSFWGDTSLLYEHEMTDYGKQLALIMRNIAKTIKKQIVETEKEYWCKKEYYFYTKVLETDYQKEIPELR